MDAFDIFKKLTRGIRFSKEYNPKLNSPKPPIPVIKIEENKTETQLSNNKIKHEDPENSITILSTLNNVQPKGKKRKLKDEKSSEHKEKQLKIEETNHYRNQNRISVVGRKIPDPFRNFVDFPVDSYLIENLLKCGYEEPTAVQKQAIPILLQGRNLLACAPTGSGKTAAFLVPIINDLKEPRKQGFRALILCPTRELAKQTQRECLKLSEGKGFRVHILSKINKALEQYGPNSSQKYDILITTPNRLCFLLKQDPPAISLSNVEWIIIDEADKLFETGNRGFKDQMDQILIACSNKERKIAMFSATYTPFVAKWCVHHMKGLIRITIGQRNAATDLVDQELKFVGNEQGKLLAFRDLVRQGLTPPVLVFVQSKERAQQLFNELIYDGINVDAIHADRTQLQRDNTVRCFREGKIWVLICTELMARGIDFKGVSLVINYDFPPSAISYVHRVGRAGRAGRRGKAVTFFTIEDTVNLRSIAHVLKDSGCEVPEYMLTMKKRSKKERKKLEISAPIRDDVVLRPKYQLVKNIKRRNPDNNNTNSLDKKQKTIPGKAKKIVETNNKIKRRSVGFKCKKIEMNSNKNSLKKATSDKKNTKKSQKKVKS